MVSAFSGPTGTTMVCPALFPPAHLAQMSTCADKISTSFPFPSSPHWDPRTTVTEREGEKKKTKSQDSVTNEPFVLEIPLIDYGKQRPQDRDPRKNQKLIAPFRLYPGVCVL